MRQIKSFILLAASQGVGIFFWALFTPSESASTIFLWFSLTRLILLAVIGLLCLLLCGLVIWLWKSPNKIQALMQKVDYWCIQKKRLVLSLIVLTALFFVISVPTLKIITTPLDYDIYGIWAPYTFPFLYSLVNNLLPILTWVALCTLEMVLLLVFRYKEYLSRSEMWSWQHVEGGVIVLIILVATFFHWAILGFQLRFFANNPAWYWTISFKSFTIRDLLLTAVVTLLFGAIYWAVFHRRLVRFGLLLVFLAGCLLQFGIGYLENNSMDALRQRYLSRYHNIYMVKATENTRTILDNIRQYEILHTSTFTSTKPPGLISFFILLDKIVNWNVSPYESSERLERLSWAITYSFPVIAMMMVFGLYAFANKYHLSKSGLAAKITPMLFVLCPNVILFSLYPDQAIYPGLFLFSAWLAIEVILRQSLFAAFIFGIYLYLAIFFSFTMLPLFPFFGLFLAINYWVKRKELKLSRQIALGLMAIIGTVFLYFAFRGLLNYDFFTRFEKTVTINHNFDFYLRVGHQPPGVPESIDIRLRQIIQAAWINNLEFASTVGFPIFILFITCAVRFVIRLLKQSAHGGDIILGAFLLTYIILNLAGTAQGEVGRLWLFWVPMVLFFATLEAEKLARKNSLALLGLFVLQYGTLILTFHFQDLRM